MNISILRALFLASILSLSWNLVGCGSFVFVSAQKDLNYQFERSETIFVYLPNEVSVNEKNFHTVTQNELKSLGYNVRNEMSEAQLVLAFTVRTEKIESVVYSSPPNYGYWDRYYPDFFWPGPMYNRYYPRKYYISQDATVAKVQLFNAREFEKGKRIPLWEGEISGEEETLRNGIGDFLRPLLSKIGQSFEGRVNVAQ